VNQRQQNFRELANTAFEEPPKTKIREAAFFKQAEILRKG
jgi:hypothetical protein